MWILGGEFFFWSKAVDPRRKPRVYCLAPEKNPPLISTTPPEEAEKEGVEIGGNAHIP